MLRGETSRSECRDRGSLTIARDLVIYQERPEDDINSPAGAWRRRAACRRVSPIRRTGPKLTTRPDVMFPADLRGPGDQRLTGKAKTRAEMAALTLCASCPVRVECLAYAVFYDEPIGVWGGLMPSARRTVRRALMNPSPTRSTTRRKLREVRDVTNAATAIRRLMVGGNVLAAAEAIVRDDEAVAA